MSPTRRATGALAACLALVLGGVSCSGGSDSGPSGGASTPPPVATATTVGQVVGHVGRAKQKAAVAEIGKVVDGWWDAAYVGGDYPRSDFSGAFPGFTPGAARQAAKDERLMSNADIGSRIDAVTALQRRVDVDLLGVKGAPEGATARVRLVFRTQGELAKKVTVTGRLRLTPTSDGWQVFGYDVAKGGK